MYLIITASPNTGGLTAACGQAAYDGITGAGGVAEVVDISAAKLEPCKICGNGWGLVSRQRSVSLAMRFPNSKPKFATRTA